MGDAMLVKERHGAVQAAVEETHGVPGCLVVGRDEYFVPFLVLFHCVTKNSLSVQPCGMRGEWNFLFPSLTSISASKPLCGLQIEPDNCLYFATKLRFFNGMAKFFCGMFVYRPEKWPVV